jgi:hypothetical protein
MDIRCPKCDRKLMTLTYERLDNAFVIETVCPRCPKHPKVDITFPHPLTGSPVLPMVAMV